MRKCLILSTATIVCNPVTAQLLNVLGYTAGVTSNDASLKASFPYVASPWAGTHNCDCATTNMANKTGSSPAYQATANEKPSSLGLSAPELNVTAYPNPSDGNSIIRYSVDAPSAIKIIVSDMQGKLIKVLSDKKQDSGIYTLQWDNSNMAKGVYLVTVYKNGLSKQVVKIVKN